MHWEILGEHQNGFAALNSTTLIPGVLRSFPPPTSSKTSPPPAAYLSSSDQQSSEFQARSPSIRSFPPSLDVPSTPFLPFPGSGMGPSIVSEDVQLGYGASTHPFLFRMEFSVDIYTCIKVALCSLAETLIFFQKLSVELAQIVELLVGGILMAIHFIPNPACRRCYRYHALNVEEVLPRAAVSNVIFESLLGNAYVTVTDLRGKNVMDRRNRLSSMFLLIMVCSRHPLFGSTRYLLTSDTPAMSG